MALLLGAKDLGLRPDWRFRFVGVGRVADTTPGVVYLDVGGALKPGVVDHHQLLSAGTSSSELVILHRELVYNHLLGEWLRRHDEGQIKPGQACPLTLITHSSPDWDSVVAAYLTMKLVEEGDFPDYAQALADYARQVDQGRYRLRPEDAEAVFAPHLGYLAIQNLLRDGHPLSSEECLRRGVALLERVLSDLTAARGPHGLRSAEAFLPNSAGATAWTDDNQFYEIRELLEGEPAKFERDLGRSKSLEAVEVPASDGSGPVSIRGLIARQVPESILNRYWARAVGYPLFVAPLGTPGETIDAEEADTDPQYIISVDPNFELDGHKVNLKGLGYTLERAEAKARRSTKDGSKQRGGEPRFGDGYCDNSDPWYDGRGHDWTIVASPRSGTVLSLSTIEKTLTESSFWEIPLREAESVLIWPDRPEIPGPGSTPPQFPSSFSRLLQSLYSEARRTEIQEPPDIDVAGLPFSLSSELRHFPAGTCRSMRMLRIHAEAGATLEGLYRLKKRLAAELSEGEPTYDYTRLRLGVHFSSGEQVAHQLALLADGAVELSRDPGRDLLVVNGANVLECRESEVAFASSPESRVETIVYSAFLNESLLSFSSRVNDLVPAGDGSISSLATESLRRDLIRFQSRYFQLEASREANGRRLFQELTTSLHISDQYHEVLLELDRLREIEDQYAETRRSRAERAFEFILFLVAIFGSFQTLVTFYTLPGKVWNAPGFKLWAWGLCIGAIAVYLAISWYRSSRHT